MFLISHVPVNNKLYFDKISRQNVGEVKSQMRFHKGFGHIKNAIS